MGLLQDRVAVITGGTRGIGLAIARAFAAEGACVVAASRSQAAVAETVASLKSSGWRAVGMPLDVTRLDEVEDLARYAVREFGRLDIWVNNAGAAGPYGPSVDLAPEDFHQVVQTNILGVYHGSRAAVKTFLPQGSGKLINMLGRGWKSPVPYQNAYSASKAWVRSFTLALAQEHKDSGLGIFAYSPGMVLTDLLTDVEVIQGHEHRLKSFPTIVRILAKPPELAAQKALWIASPATDGKTGKIYTYSSGAQILKDFLREGMRRLLKRPAPSMPIKVKTIPPS